VKEDGTGRVGGWVGCGGWKLDSTFLRAATSFRSHPEVLHLSLFVTVCSVCVILCEFTWLPRRERSAVLAWPRASRRYALKLNHSSGVPRGVWPYANCRGVQFPVGATILARFQNLYWLVLSPNVSNTTAATSTTWPPSMKGSFHYF
jgi:hypothetical protein